jgi:hypothetical protein
MACHRHAMNERNMLQVPEVATGNQSSLASPYTDKRGFGRRWQGSPRWVDNLLAQGLPHLKIGKRRVRICLAEADAWMQETFRVQRRGAAR